MYKKDDGNIGIKIEISIIFAITIVLFAFKISGIRPELTWLQVFSPLIILIIYYLIVCIVMLITVGIVGVFTERKSFRNMSMVIRKDDFESSEPMYWDPATKQFYIKSGPITNNFGGDDNND